MHDTSLNPTTAFPSLSYEPLFRQLLDMVPQLVFWKDTQSRYLGCNQQFAQLLGLASPQDLIGKTDFELGWQVQGDNALAFREGDRFTMLGDPMVDKEELLALSKREPLIVSVNKRPLYDEAGAIIGVLVTALDITESKKTQQAMEEAKAQAEYARQAKTSFIQHISHDIHTPFFGMLRLAELLKENQEDPAYQMIAAGLKESSQTLLNWFNQIIQILQLESYNDYPHRELFWLKKTVEDVVTLCKVNAFLKEVVIKTEYAADLPDTLLGDEFKLKRLLLNLIGNAVDFTHRGMVRVTLKMVGGQGDDPLRLEIVVQDTGAGITLEHQASILEYFSRAHPSPGFLKPKPAPGQGLAIVKDMLTALRGSLTLSSTLGQGTSFCVRLPFTPFTQTGN